MQMLSNRRAQLDVFERLLNDEEYFAHEQEDKHGPEAVWQAFFEDNPWIFGYGLKLVACQPLDDGKLERITAGANIFTGAGRRSDAVMRTRGYVSSLMFCEIKTHKTLLLESRPYREPDIFQVSREVTGAVSQVQKTVDKALMVVSREFHRHYEADGTPTGVQFSTSRPRQAILVGRLDQFDTDYGVNSAKLSSFELYRNLIHDIEIITFDELYARARFIVSDN